MMRPDELSRPALTTALALVFASLCLFATSCAGVNNAVETGRPRADVPYPVVLGGADERRAKSLAAWKALAVEQGATVALADVPEIDPATGTLRTLPAPSPATLRLPFVGASGASEMTEDEEREALRRFIAGQAALLGVEPADLSLVEHTQSGAVTLARYRQNPFDYPLRGDYGRLEITYAPDRRVVSLTNTAIPDAAQLKRALSGAKTLKQDELTRALVGRSVTFTDAQGRRQTRAVTSADEISVREIVIYPVRDEAAPPSLALHLAWEVAVWQDSPVLVYVDAVTGAHLAAAPADAS